MVEFAPTLIPPELWLTLGSAETHEAGQTMLPATQKSWAARQPPLSPHSRFIPKASASLMRATCSTVTSRSYVNKWAWICFTFPPCLSITGLTYRNSHTPDIEVHTSSRTSKAHALFPQTAIGVIQTQLSKLHHFQCSRGETGGVSRKGSTHTMHTSAQRYVMDNIWNDSLGPRCRPGTHLVRASLPTNQSRSAARGRSHL